MLTESDFVKQKLGLICLFLVQRKRIVARASYIISIWIGPTRFFSLKAVVVVSCNRVCSSKSCRKGYCINAVNRLHKTRTGVQLYIILLLFYPSTFGTQLNLKVKISIIFQQHSRRAFLASQSILQKRIKDMTT